MKKTIGNLIDELSIANLKIWMAEDVKRDRKASDKKIANACRKTNVANQQRNDLIEAIDLAINEMVVSQEPQKLYGQGSTKSYGKTDM